MSFAELTAETDIERVIKALDVLSARLDKFAEAINGLGQNQQWLIDQAQGIFQMFGNPSFLSALPGMMNPAGMQAAAEAAAGTENGNG